MQWALSQLIGVEAFCTVENLQTIINIYRDRQVKIVNMQRREDIYPRLAKLGSVFDGLDIVRRFLLTFTLGTYTRSVGFDRSVHPQHHMSIYTSTISGRPRGLNFHRTAVNLLSEL